MNYTHKEKARENYYSNRALQFNWNNETILKFFDNVINFVEDLKELKTRGTKIRPIDWKIENSCFIDIMQTMEIQKLITM
jgi:hypothetical protein